MKSLLVIFLLTCGVQAFAADGDLTVDGKLGIGTTGPANNLHVNGGITWGGNSRPVAFSSEDSNGLYLEQIGQDTATSRVRIQSSINGDATNYSQFFIDPLNGFSFLARTSANGNVGIGTATPKAQLDISSARCNPPEDYEVLSMTGCDQSGMGNYFKIRGNTNNSLDLDYRGISNKLMLYGNGHTGDIGVGTSTPTTKLHVNGAITWGGNTRPIAYSGEDSNGLYFEQVGQDSTTSRVRLQSSTSGDVTNYSQLFIDPFNGFSFMARGTANGNVGIGTTDPQGYRLYVSGPAYSTGGWQGSDGRFKEDLQPLNDSLDKVLKLDGVSYKWKTEQYKDKGFPEGRHYGVIAQEIEQVLPEVVNTAPDGTKAVAYTEIIPLLIEAIKEQQTIIEKQLERIERLELRP